MARVRLRSGLRGEMTSLADHLVVAIDLGFAKSKKSCGVAWQDGREQPPSQGVQVQFGECITKVASLLKEHSTAVLIIEAPLSGLFSVNGNPVEREFEKFDGNQRYWYCGAGAATCLAAVFFLRKLVAEVEQLPEIVIYEGLVTFKLKATDKPKATEDHVADAQLLLDCFFGRQASDVHEVMAKDGQAVIAITDVVAGSIAGTGAPAIIAPRKGNA